MILDDGYFIKEEDTINQKKVKQIASIGTMKEYNLPTVFLEITSVPTGTLEVSLPYLQKDE